MLKINFIRRLSWSIFSHFVAVQCRNVQCVQKLQKKCTKNPFLGGSRSFKVIDVDKSQKPVTSATVFTLHEIIAVKYPLFRG